MGWDFEKTKILLMSIGVVVIMASILFILYVTIQLVIGDVEMLTNLVANKNRIFQNCVSISCVLFLFIILLFELWL